MKPVISAEAVEFIKTDIEREIMLAVLSESRSYKFTSMLFKLPVGGGNFLCALGLLCYKEFFGRELINSSGSKRNFDAFFEKMGPSYKDLLGTHNIYNTFRCGLAHEYWVKKSGTVYMFGDKSPALGFDKYKNFYFIVEKYYDDLIKTVNAEFALI
jgi:hypothetical protein